MTDRREPMGLGEDRSTREKMKESAHDAKDKVSEAASELKDRGEHLVEEGKEMGREMADRAGEAARSRADEEKDRVAGGMRAVAHALRAGSDELPADKRAYRRFMEGVADRVSDASRYLDERDVNALSRDVRRVARDHTTAFLGGAFMLGMMGARFLKSSPDEAREGRREEWSGRDALYSRHPLSDREPLSGRDTLPGSEGTHGHERPRGLPEPGRPEQDYGMEDPRGEDGYARGI
jgi:hypothetical protein